MLPPGTTTKILENRVKEKSASFVYLKKETEEIEELIENNKIKSEKQIRALRFLIEIENKQVERNPFIHKVVKSDTDLVLTEEQNKAYEQVCEAIDEHLYSEFLLFGVTGSRKNRSIFTTNRKSNKRRKN